MDTPGSAKVRATGVNNGEGTEAKAADDPRSVSEGLTLDIGEGESATFKIVAMA